jgi:hypothetical protein
MSRMLAFLDRIRNLKNVAPAFFAALVDDGATPPPAPGEPTALRVDPTTGELLVKSSGGGGGTSTVDQGEGNLDTTASPWTVHDPDYDASIFTEAPPLDAKAFAVRPVGAQLMSVGPGVAPPGESAQSFYLIQAGEGGPVTDDFGAERLGVVITGPIGAKTTAESVAVSLPTDMGPLSVSATSLPLPTGASTEAKQPAFGTAGTPSADVLSVQGIGGGTPMPVSGTFFQATQPVSNAVSSQVDGHSATIGATADADTANTLIGRIKNLLSRIPAALVGGRFDSNLGSWFGSTAPTVGVKAAADSIPVTIASDQGLFSVTTAPRVVTERTIGPIAAAQNETLKGSAGRLFWLRVEGASAGTYYLQLHDAANTGAIGAGTIHGLGYQISGAGDELLLDFSTAPHSFANGISYALSTTKNTYNAAAGKTVFVEAGWE